MEIKITNIYNDIAPPNSEFIADHGQAFLISTPEGNILFDTGAKGRILLHNMSALKFDSDEVHTVILSHGHYDHTGGLSTFLKTRSSSEPVTIIAHPLVFHPKGALEGKKGSLIKTIGFPKLSKKCLARCNFQLTKESSIITPNVVTLGEISLRPFKDGTSNTHVFFINEQWLPDTILDDLSVIIRIKKGLVLLCGCCHAGLLNTLLKVEKLFPNEKIFSIIGGTHMFRFSYEEVELVARKLKEKYSSPKLFLNHCTGINIIDQLSDVFSSEIVGNCLIGESFILEC